MKIVGSVQARMASTRLPGKVLREVQGQPLLGWQLDRLTHARLLDAMIVATSTNASDDPIAEFCRQRKVPCFRGSENDVLSRISEAIQEYQIDIHVELFGDCPLIDPHIIDEMIGTFLKQSPKYDCICNSVKTTYPPGQEVTVHRGSILTEANSYVPPGDPLREHVGIHITKNPRYRVLNLEAPEHYRHPEMYLEVDTGNDLKFVSNIIEHFVDLGQRHFSLAQMIEYLQQNPGLIEINQDEERRWKEFRDDP